MKIFIKEKLTFNDKIVPLKVYKGITIARSGSQEYSESEIKAGGDPFVLVTVHRFKDEVEKSATRMNNIPIVENHPEEHMDIEEPKATVIGVVTNPRFKDGTVVADLVFYRKPSFDEFSLGYDAELSFIDGKYQQTNIVPNHLANLNKSRCGIICSLKSNKKVNNMKVTINDKQIDVAEAVGAYIVVLQKTIEENAEGVAKAFKDGVTAQVDREKVALVAKNRKIAFKDTDSVKTIKMAIAKDLGIRVEGKDMTFIDGVIETSLLLSKKFEDKSVTNPDDFKFEDLTMGGE